MRKGLSLVPLLLLLFSCQNEQFQYDDQVTQISVIQVNDLSPSPDQYERKGKIINEISSKKKIDQVHHALIKADVESTENVDLALPSYKVHFLKENKIVQTLGYYPPDQDHEAAFSH
ncbi:hypothetical protein [Pseudalkalibacillus hwajinpoensis]|uniref:hypothetical protein n=1 Tax=Guptibacillus hwajinpoensis TaxID=208199 RepID=UPI001CFD4E40|nr:hypothetical protein [Pseudalkalibacillus hwajinpoensis]